MPPIGEVFEKHGAATADFSVVRLHGGDREGIEARTGKKWSRIVVPQPEGIRAAAAITQSNAHKGILTIVNVNNHYEGSAPLTLERFLDELRKTSAAGPPC